MGAIRVVDRKRMARVVVGAAILLGVAGLGTLMWGGPMETVLRPKLAAGQFLLLVLAASALLAGAGALWRRRTGYRPSWVRPAVVTATAGAVAGQVATVVTSSYVAAGWTVPILVSAVLVVAVPVAFLITRRLREPFAGQSAQVA